MFLPEQGQAAGWHHQPGSGAVPRMCAWPWAGPTGLRPRPLSQTAASLKGTRGGDMSKLFWTEYLLARFGTRSRAEECSVWAGAREQTWSSQQALRKVRPFSAVDQENARYFWWQLNYYSDKRKTEGKKKEGEKSLRFTRFLCTMHLNSESIRSLSDSSFC